MESRAEVATESPPLGDVATRRRRGQRGPGRRRTNGAWMCKADVIAAGISNASLKYLRGHRLIGVRQVPGSNAMYAREDVERIVSEATLPAIERSAESA
jgi:hypothetical protein